MNEVRAIRRKEAGRAETIVVAGGKGGVGKTNLALNLGLQLARRGARTILLDADFGLANADILLNLSPRADLSDLLDSRRAVADLLVAGPEGLRVLCGVSGLTRSGAPCEIDAARCAQAVARLETACDFLIVDCAAGVGPLVTAFALAGDLLLLVTTPEPPALADAYATLKILWNRGLSGRVGLVVNLARNRRQAERVARRFCRVAAQFLGLPVEYLGCVPLDRHVAWAVQARTPVAVRYPRCAASLCIEELSGQFMRPAAAAPVSQRLWTRVAELFL